MSVTTNTVDPVDERLPIGKLFMLGLQHVLVMYAGAVAVPLIIGGALGLPKDQIAFLISADLMCCGIATLIQSVGVGRFGIRMPVVMAVTFAAVGPMLAIGTNPSLGLPGIFGATIAAGIIGTLLAPAVGKLLRFFPPIVTGIVITSIGLTIIGVGINWAAGGVGNPDYGDPVYLGVSFAVLIFILLITRFVKGFFSNIAVLLGILFGFAIALMLHKVNFDGLDQVKWFDVVLPFHFGMPVFDPWAIVTLTIVMLTLLTAVAIGGSVQADTALALVGHLGLFVLVGMILGLLLLPRLVDYVAGFGRDETLLVSVLGICFGASLLAVWMGFSVALGAFLAGAVVAESRSVDRVLHLVEPLRDMFAALFFVAIGLKIDPAMLGQYVLPALLIAVVVIVGKTLACSVGILAVGHDARTALRSGLSMAQIGEFSFVIATLGLSLGAISDFLYPIAVAVSVLCMAASPYLGRSADRLADGLSRVTPHSMRLLVESYSGWLENLKPVDENAVLAAMLRRLLWHIAVNVLLVVTLFLIGAYVNSHGWSWFSQLGIERDLRHELIWAAALFLSLPMLIAVYRKAEALGMLLAELGIRERFAGAYTHRIRSVLARIIPLATLFVLALLVSALGATILPPRGVALSLLVVGVVLAVVLWRSLVKLHARLQAALKETLDKPETPRPGDPS